MDQQPCPHCGYCPTCGRAAQPTTVKIYPPSPFYPVQPWYQQPYTVTYGNVSSSAGIAN